MTFVYAGEYASDVLYRTQGAAGNAAVTVTTSADEPATLYTDATKDTPLASNVVDTDPYGNLTFFADPGTYTCSVGSASFTAVVAVNPLEPGGGSGSVTSVAVESANGLAGTVADPTSTPQITLSTTATGVLKGASGVIEAATAGTDYLAPSGSGAALTGITATQVGADASGAAATAQGSAETFATSAVAAETSRAETAEGLLAPKASPALTGTPVAPTASALTDSTQIATTAYADAAVTVETSRAETAEALKAPLASPALTGNPTAPTQTSSDNSTKIATDAFVQTAASTAQSGAEAASVSASVMTTLGDSLYGGASGAAARLAGNTSATKKFWTQTGTGSASAAPVLGTIATSDLPGSLPLLQATTGLTGYTLVNGTGTILSWAVPNDGNMHRFAMYGVLIVGSTETGGALQINYTDPGGTARTPALIGGAQGSGLHQVPVTNFTVAPNQTVTITQAAALTGGAAVLYAELWGS